MAIVLMDLTLHRGASESQKFCNPGYKNWKQVKKGRVAAQVVQASYPHHLLHRQH